MRIPNPPGYEATLKNVFLSTLFSLAVVVPISFYPCVDPDPRNEVLALVGTIFVIVFGAPWNAMSFVIILLIGSKFGEPINTVLAIADAVMPCSPSTSSNFSFLATIWLSSVVGLFTNMMLAFMIHFSGIGPKQTDQIYQAIVNVFRQRSPNK